MNRSAIKPCRQCQSANLQGTVPYKLSHIHNSIHDWQAPPLIPVGRQEATLVASILAVVHIIHNSTIMVQILLVVSLPAKPVASLLINGHARATQERTSL